MYFGLRSFICRQMDICCKKKLLYRLFHKDGMIFIWLHADTSSLCGVLGSVKGS
jgi:hypothetical protein